MRTRRALKAADAAAVTANEDSGSCDVSSRPKRGSRAVKKAAEADILPKRRTRQQTKHHEHAESQEDEAANTLKQEEPDIFTLVLEEDGAVELKAAPNEAVEPKSEAKLVSSTPKATRRSSRRAKKDPPSRDYEAITASKATTPKQTPSKLRLALKGILATPKAWKEKMTPKGSRVEFATDTKRRDGYLKEDGVWRSEADEPSEVRNLRNAFERQVTLQEGVEEALEVGLVAPGVDDHNDISDEDNEPENASDIEQDTAAEGDNFNDTGAADANEFADENVGVEEAKETTNDGDAKREQNQVTSGEEEEISGLLVPQSPVFPVHGLTETILGTAQQTIDSPEFRGNISLFGDDTELPKIHGEAVNKAVRQSVVAKLQRSIIKSHKRPDKFGQVKGSHTKKKAASVFKKFFELAGMATPKPTDIDGKSTANWPKFQVTLMAIDEVIDAPSNGIWPKPGNARAPTRLLLGLFDASQKELFVNTLSKALEQDMQSSDELEVSFIYEDDEMNRSVFSRKGENRDRPTANKTVKVASKKLDNTPSKHAAIDLSMM